MKLDKFKKIIANTAPDERELISMNMDILERIHELLNLKFDGKQNLLAEKMGKSEPEISKLLSGFHNYTMQTIVKLQLAFNAPILVVATGKDIANAHFQQVKISECLRDKKELVEMQAQKQFFSEEKSYKVVKTLSN